MSKVSILTSFLVLISFALVQGEASATKLSARPLPSERELKDFEGSQGLTPSVTRFQRRMDYREEEKLRQEQEQRARQQAAEHAVKAHAMQVQSVAQRQRQALEANNRGVAAGKAGRWTDAIAAHEEAVQYEPANKQYRINLSAARCAFGQARMQVKDYNAAAGLFRKSLAAAQDNSLAAKMLAEAMKRQGFDPDSPEDRLTVGDGLAAVGDLESAMIEYQAALAMDPSPQTLTKMGDMYLRYNQVAVATNYYRQAIDKDKENKFSGAYRQLGLLQASQKDMTGAAASLRKAVINDAKDTIAGQALVEIWRRQVAANPLLAENHLGLAGALQLTGDFNGADAEYNKLAALEPNNPSLPGGRASLARARAHAAAEKHKLAAETLFNQGLRREALAEISQAVMAEPKNDKYQFLLGECLEACGDLRGAHQAYLTAVLINPERNKEAAYRMKEMQRGNTLHNMPAQHQMPPQHHQQAPVVMTQTPPVQHAQQIPPTFSKNMYEGGSSGQSAAAPSMPSSFAMHDEPRHSVQNVAVPMQAAPNHVQAAAPVQNQVPVAAAVPVQHQAPAQHAVATPAPAAQDPVLAGVFAKAAELEAARDYKTAVQVLRAIMPSHLKNADLHHRLAVDLLANGDIAECIAEFRIASALTPTNKAYAEDLARALAIHKRSIEPTATSESVPAASGKEVATK